MNSVTLIGNLADHPDLSYTAQGTAVTELVVAVSRRIRDAFGSWTSTRDGFIPVVAWRDLAEHAAENLAKGDRVVIAGRLTQDSYTDRDGIRRTSIKVVATEVAPGLQFADLDDL